MTRTENRDGFISVATTRGYVEKLRDFNLTKTEAMNTIGLWADEFFDIPVNLALGPDVDYDAYESAVGNYIDGQIGIYAETHVASDRSMYEYMLDILIAWSGVDERTGSSGDADIDRDYRRMKTWLESKRDVLISDED